MDPILSTIYKEYFYTNMLLPYDQLAEREVCSFIKKYLVSLAPIPHNTQQLYYMYLVSSNLSTLATLQYGDYLFDLRTISFGVDMDEVRKFYQKFTTKKFTNYIKGLG